MEKVPANNMEKSKENILRQLAKSGDTNFRVTGIETCGNEQYFFTSLQLNELRRGLLDRLTEWRSSRIPSVNKQNSSSYTADETPYPADSRNFEKNITNRLAVQFYRRHGIENPVMGVEKREIKGRLQVMLTKHCLQYELGFCPRYGGTFPAHFAQPFFLKDGATRFELEFDCKNCMMKVFKEISNEK
jgi:putative protease